MTKLHKTHKKQRTHATKRRQSKSSLDSWISRHPVKLIYGSVMIVFVFSIVSIWFIAKTNAATTDSTTGATKKTTSTTPATTTKTATATSCGTARIQKMVNSVSSAKIKANLTELTTDNSKPKPNSLISRHVSSPGNQIKVDWAKKQMKAYKLTVINQPFTSDGHKLNNVVARLSGTNKTSFYVVGAHIDAINGGDDGDNSSSKAAPGADDDGSGIIAMMEAGRVLKAWQPCMKTSIDFNGYNDEEEEMNGSKTYLKKMSGKKIRGAYNMDMIGYAPDKECLKSDIKKASRDNVMAKKITAVNTKYKIGMNVSNGTYTQNGGDDLEPFWKANIPGGYLIECTTEKDTDGYPNYHSPKDTPKNVNISQVTKTTKLLVAALAELSAK